MSREFAVSSDGRGGVIGVGGLRPIGLEELVARAALQVRRDRKYILPVADLPTVLHGLMDDVRVLEIDRRREFGYRSLYFDTPALDSYLAAARRRPRRFKIRIREYVDTGARFFEVKTRGRRDTTVKHRIPYTGDGLGRDALAYAGAVLGEAGTGPFLPVLTTHYRRITLFVPSAGGRVTIDTALTWTTPDGATVHTPDRAIVETKSDRTASRVDRLLWSLGHRPCPVSKFATGLAALRPDLPANRWQPVLRRHFRTTAPIEERTP